MEEEIDDITSEDLVPEIELTITEDLVQEPIVLEETIHDKVTTTCGGEYTGETEPYFPIDDLIKEKVEVENLRIEQKGHTSGKCNLCSCTHFTPSFNSSYCICGHHDWEHEWI